MHEKGLTPETQLRVLVQGGIGNEQDESFIVQVGEREVCISKSAAAKIWVIQ